MDKKTYERKINGIIMKCPIEAGVEILVYSLLDEFIDSKKLSLVDINRIWKNKDPRLINFRQWMTVYIKGIQTT